jgi:hypothetical protein
MSRHLRFSKRFTQEITDFDSPTRCETAAARRGLISLNIEFYPRGGGDFYQ